jgi:predicted nucleotidyltransferase
LTDLAAAIENGLAAMTPRGLRCALVGGFAVSVRTEPRFTRDIDLVVAVPDDATAEELLPGVIVPVATVGHLIALKLLARDDRVRPQDAGDLRSLLAVADQADMNFARDAVAMIETRGFARGRELSSDLEALRQT